MSGDVSRQELRERRNEVEEDNGDQPANRTGPPRATGTFRFNEHVERVGKVAVVLVLEASHPLTLTPSGWWFVPLLFLWYVRSPCGRA